MFKSKEDFFRKANLTTTYIFTLIVIGLIALLFPRFVSFNYDYDIGKEWKHEEIIAPFDFPVLKPDTLYERQVLEEVSAVLPVYVIESVNTKDLANDLAARIKQYTPSTDINISTLSKVIEEILQEEYTIGVGNNIPSSRITMVSSQSSKRVSTKEMLSPPEVVQQIINGLKNDEIIIESEGINAITSLIKPNLRYDRKATEALKDQAQNEVSRSNGLVRQGEIVVSNGEVISLETDRKLSSLKTAYRNGLGKSKNAMIVFSGYLLLTFLIIVVLMFYIKTYFPVVFNSFQKMSFILIWPLIFSYLVYAIDRTNSLSSYLIPFCIVPIILKNFYTERLALFVHIVVVLIASFLSELGYEFTFLQILAGIVTVLVVNEIRDWEKFFKALAVILGVYILAYLGLSFISEGNINDIETKVFLWLALNVLLTMLAYPFIPLLERLFGFTSSISLAELADMNRPLLRELSFKSPGTLQHSLQVANLAETAAEKIGANSLLVKTAALYHDIGKTIAPENFIENQIGGNNPHEEMNNFQSAKAIIDHVIEGEKMAKKARLPQVVIDFITTHHGTTRTEYFYRKQLTDFPDKEFDETLFRYPGPKPRTKEEAIMMLADSIEAASKSLKNPTGLDIDKLVDNIVAGKIQQQQLEDSELSFRELETCVEVFKQLLRSIYHVRVEYPKDPNTAKTSDQEE